MSHELKADEIAIVIRPMNYEDDWDGDVAINLAIAKDTPVPPEIQAHILNLATMMSTFLDVANDYPDLYELVEERRNFLMDIVDEQEDEELDVVQEGNVYTLNKWTKTEGSA
jgi:hypothetical protein